jgi:hypothetical protein
MNMFVDERFSMNMFINEQFSMNMFINEQFSMNMFINEQFSVTALSLDFGESSLEYVCLVSPLLPGTGILRIYFQCVLSPAQICSVTIFRNCPLPLALQKLIQFFGVCQKGLTGYIYT